MANGEEPRSFGAGRAVLRFSNSTSHAIERIVMWDWIDNEPELLDFNFVELHEASPTEVQSRKVYTHIDGLRFHASLRFSYWHQDYAYNPAPRATFTEHDYRYIKLAQVGTTFDIEFFPFDTLPMGTPPNSTYQCRIVNLTRMRSDSNAWKWDCVLEVEGVNKLTTIPVT